jgi:MFS family permease
MADVPGGNLREALGTDDKREEFREKAKTQSFKPVEGAENYNRALTMLILCMITATEGADGALFPANTKAIEYNSERTWGISVKDIGILSVIQSLSGVVSGPLCGIIASRGTLHRRDILFIGVIVQGSATIAMCWNFHMAILIPLRMLNGFALASLRPIANSIVGDLYADEERGQAFGYIMLSLNFGSAIFGITATSMSESTIMGIPGWRLSFLLVGFFTVALSFPVRAFMEVPAVTPDEEKLKAGLRGELEALFRLMKMWTFTGCVLQGMFGLIPWKAFEFRILFFQISEISNFWAGFINSAGQFAGGLGNFFGGIIGDTLASKIDKCHGRIINAELSIFLGIPVALFTFLIQPDFTPGGSGAVAYYMILTILLGLVATWVPAGTNSPVLCTIVSEQDRALILAWQTSLEGAIGSLGPFIFSTFASMMGYNSECGNDDYKKEHEEECDNASAAGTSLFLCTCLPWGLAGAVYSTLFYSYPRDLEMIIAERAEKLMQQNGMASDPQDAEAEDVVTAETS